MTRTKKTTKKATVTKTTKKATVKKATNKKAKVTVLTPPFFITSAEYEGAIRARAVIKNELNLNDPKLFARYCYFNQLINLYDAQQTGNFLID
jgi:hypothetical protein